MYIIYEYQRTKSIRSGRVAREGSSFLFSCALSLLIRYEALATYTSQHSEAPTSTLKRSIQNDTGIRRILNNEKENISN